MWCDVMWCEKEAPSSLPARKKRYDAILRYSRPVLHKAKHKHYCTRFRFGSTTAAVPKTRGPIRRSREVGRRAGGRAGARERRRDRGGEAGEGQIRQNATRFGNSQSLGRHGLPFFPLQSVHVSMPDVPPWAVGRAGAVRFGSVSEGHREKLRASS